MGDENPIRTLGDYSKPRHEGYRNTIELPEGNNVVPIRSDTIRLVQNGCSFHRLRSEDPNKHLKDFLKLVESLDLNVANRERTLPHHGIDLWLQVQIFYDHVNPATRRTIDQSVDGKLRDRNAEESWALLEDLALYDNESWNDPRDFAKPVKAISLPQDVPMVPTTLTTAWKILSKLLSIMHPRVPTKREAIDARLSNFEADFKQQQSDMTNKIDTVLKAITNQITGALPSNTVKNPELNVNPTYSVLSARYYPTDDPQCSTQIHSSINSISICPKRPGKSQTGKPEEEDQDEKDNPENINTNPSSLPDPLISFIIEKIIRMNDDSHKEEPEVGENAGVRELWG
ncbi:hypothetical protein Tco_1115543 [Tanacetum coccineum]